MPQTAIPPALVPSFGEVGLPSYDRTQLQPSIVHIGMGGFHRAHFATYVHDACELGHRDWSITGAGVLPGDAAMASALGAQDHLYTLITRGPAHTAVDIVGSVTGYIHAYPDTARLVAQIASPITQIVSLTVTEGGYPIDDVTGSYVADSPTAGPASAFGIIAAALDQRRLAGGPPVTVLSFDNIMGNGVAARTATLGEAQKISTELVRWISDSVSFPNSMVDRITPATADTDRSWLSSTHGVDDQWPVVAEPFRQWVIEDNFAGHRLPLEDLDVIVTDDVAPYEFMKLRLLNAGHSCLAYLAALVGIDTVDRAMAHSSLHGFVAAFLNHEAKPALPPVDNVNLDTYTSSLLERFANPQIGDQISRLCLDGSAKFPKFLLPTVRAQLAAGAPVGFAALALAGWCEYLNGRTEDGAEIVLAADPLLDQAVAHARASQDDPRAFLRFTAVFGDDLGAPGPLADAFAHALQSLREHGVRSTIGVALQETATD